jgi:hypothetical protein
MLPSGSWLHLAVGSLVGIISTLFVLRVLTLLKKNNAGKSLVGALVLYIFSIVVVSYFYASALSGGVLVEWKLLGFPALDDPAVKVIDIGYIQGKSGNIYRDNLGILERVDTITQNEDDYHVITTAGNCGTLFFLPIYKADIVDSKSACVSWGPAPAKIIYAVDSRGRVYSWWHGRGEYGGIEKLFFPIGGAIGSCMFGMFVISIGYVLIFIVDKRREANLRESSSLDTSA